MLIIRVWIHRHSLVFQVVDSDLRKSDSDNLIETYRTHSMIIRIHCISKRTWFSSVLTLLLSSNLFNILNYFESYLAFKIIKFISDILYFIQIFIKFAYLNSVLRSLLRSFESAETFVEFFFLTVLTASGSNYIEIGRKLPVRWHGSFDIGWSFLSYVFYW